MWLNSVEAAFFSRRSVEVNSYQEWFKIFQNACISCKCTTCTFCFTWSFYALLGVTSLYNFVRFWIVLSNFSDTFVIVRCLILVSKLQQGNRKNNNNINKGTIKFCNPIKSVWKTDETFVLIFGTLSLLNSRFYGMRNPFHSLSSEIVKNRPFALRGHVI